MFSAFALYGAFAFAAIGLSLTAGISDYRLTGERAAFVPAIAITVILAVLTVAVVATL